MSSPKKSINKQQAGHKGRKISKWDTTLDLILFLVVSIGFVLQTIYYTIFGKPVKSLADDVALVTGGAGGLGRLLGERLGKLGATVVLWDINQKGVQDAVDKLKSIQPDMKIHGYVVDLSDKKDVYRAAELVRKEIGDVTLLINNAGVVTGRTFLDSPDHLIERTFSVNIMSHFWTVKAFLPAMVSSSHGHVVTVASLAGHVGISKLVDYCSSKFAAVGFDEALRLELECMGVTGVYTTAICPYFINSTGMFEDVYSRFVPTLNSKDVADKIIYAIRTNEKFAIVPGYLRIMLAIKWVFPWGCVSGFLRRLVPDAAPVPPSCPVYLNNNISKIKST